MRLSFRAGAEIEQETTLVAAECAIGFDAKRYFNNASGLGSYSRNLINGWAEAYPQDQLYLFTPFAPSPDMQQVNLRQGQTLVTKQSRLLPRALWRTLAPIPACRRLKIPIFHGLSNELPLSGMRSKESLPRRVVTIHDVLFERFPEQYPQLDRLIYRAKTRHACQSADLIVAISMATSQDLQELFGVPEHRIRVIYQSVNADFSCPLQSSQSLELTARFKLPEVYVLSTGSIVHRKNQLGLLKAYATLPPKMRLPLIFAGSDSSKYAHEVKRYVQDNLGNDPIRFLGPISQSDLVGLMQGAFFTVYGSRGEGFGLPVAESLSAGVPVLASSVSSLPEAAAGLGVLFDPDNREAFAEAWTKCVETNQDLRLNISKNQSNLNPFRCIQQIQSLRQVYQSLL
jgi:glycosyltransferase involved in cell wall biosynthesis